MRVGSDRGRCKGHAQCEYFAPDVFEIDDDALVVVKLQEPDESRRSAVEEAIDHCPEAAIWLEGE